MIFRHIFITYGLLTCLFVGLPKNIQKKVNKEIKEVFGVEVFELQEKPIPESLVKTLPSAFSKDNLFEIKNNGQLLGYAYVSKAESKADTFDYLVLLDPNLIIVETKVLVYRENYGEEIGSKRWLKQFKDKTQDDTLILGDNISAISGATISARSMTNALNNLLRSLKILHEKNIL